MAQLSQLFFFSHITGLQTFETVAEIVAETRRNSAPLGITGLLLFDGEHVCHYLEGEPAAIDGLVQRLRIDPRYARLQVLHRGPLEGERRFAGWTMGCLPLDDDQDLTRFESLTGSAAVHALLKELPRVILDP